MQNIPTGISYAVSAMEMVEVLLWIVGNDMHCARHLSTFVLVISKERMQNVSKERGEGDVLVAVQRSPSTGRISRVTDVEQTQVWRILCHDGFRRCHLQSATPFTGRSLQLCKILRMAVNILLISQSFDWLAAFHLELLQAILFIAKIPRADLKTDLRRATQR
jgi:hypothetical protein